MKQIERKYSVCVYTHVSRNWMTQQTEGTYYRVTPEDFEVLKAADLLEDHGDGLEVKWEDVKDLYHKDPHSHLRDIAVEVESCTAAEVDTIGEVAFDF